MELCMEYQFDMLLVLCAGAGADLCIWVCVRTHTVVSAVVAIVMDRVRTLVRHVSKVKMCGRVWHCLPSYPSTMIFFSGHKNEQHERITEMAANSSFRSQKLIPNRFPIAHRMRTANGEHFIFIFICFRVEICHRIPCACLETKNDFVLRIFLIHFVCDYTGARSRGASCIRVAL